MSIVFLIVVVIIAFVLRARIMRIARGVGLHAAATWNDFMNDVWPAIQSTVFVAFFLVLVPMIFLGIYAHSVVSAITIVVLFPFWFLACLIPSGMINHRWFPGSGMLKLAKVLLSIALLVATVNLGIGLWSPTVKQSADRSSGNFKQVIANFLDKCSLKSESESGIFAVITEDKAVLYNDISQVVVENIPKGTPVKVVDLKGEPAAPRFEGMTKVMLKNEHGDFVGGFEGYIPSRKLDLKAKS